MVIKVSGLIFNADSMQNPWHQDAPYLAPTYDLEEQAIKFLIAVYEGNKLFPLETPHCIGYKVIERNGLKTVSDDIINSVWINAQAWFGVVGKEQTWYDHTAKTNYTYVMTAEVQEILDQTHFRKTESYKGNALALKDALAHYQKPPVEKANLEKKRCGLFSSFQQLFISDKEEESGKKVTTSVTPR